MASMTAPVNETSNGFREDYFFLSNFYVSPILISYQGEDFVLASGEHVFQGMKVAASTWSVEDNLKWLRSMEANESPGFAKKAGKRISLDVPKWNLMSMACMRRTLDLKFEQHPGLRQQLLDTGNLTLVEYNNWGDTLWGVNEKTGSGRNQLGKLLMDLRQSLRNPSL